MKAKGRTPADGRLLLTTAEDKNYETQVEINIGNGNTGGLVLFYNENAYAGVVSDGKKFIVYQMQASNWNYLMSWVNVLLLKFIIRVTICV